MDGLTHPRDLEAWHRWQDRSQPLGPAGRNECSACCATSPGPTATPATRADPGRARRRGCWSAWSRAPPPRCAPCSSRCATSTPPTSPSWPRPASRPAPGGSVDRVEQLRAGPGRPSIAGGARSCSRPGTTCPWAALAHRAAEPGRFLTVQHGLLTPHAPPLARRHDPARLERGRRRVLALRPRRRRIGRGRVPAAVGGRRAARAPRPTRTHAPVFLGQLHGAELPRDVSTRGRRDLLPGRAGAVYRPHPSERDRRSRGDPRPLGEGRHHHRPFRHPAARARRPGGQRVLHRACSRPPRPGCPRGSPCADPPSWLQRVLGPLRPRAVGRPADGITRTARGGAVPRASPRSCGG